MKNHVKIDGKRLQTNKKWSHLKQKQREWIVRITKEEYDKYILSHKKQPRKGNKAEIIDAVYEKINEREIWIPFYEAKAHIGKYIDRYNRKECAVVAENGETITVKPVIKPKKANATKPKPPAVKFGEISSEIKEYFYENMKKSIALYINDTSKIPPNKIRDAHLKTILKGFNAKLYKKTGAKVLSDDSLLSAYDNIRKELYAEYSANDKIGEKKNG